MDRNIEITPGLLLGMRAAFARGENAMEFARHETGAGQNLPAATMIAYDLQAGSYIAQATADRESNARWCGQLAEVLSGYVDPSGTLLEVGCGEATTLAGVLEHLPAAPSRALGFDISWSRCAAGLDWLKSRSQQATLFVADLFSIPLETNSVDVVYTSHSLEPNGGREEAAVHELLRVARRAVVLIEPLYELAPPEAQARMRSHGYVRNLKATVERLGGRVTDYRLLPCCGNPLNPSGLLVVEKCVEIQPEVPVRIHPGEIAWRCPFSHAPMHAGPEAFFCPESGLAYPCLRGVPLLRPEHAVVASLFDRIADRARNNRRADP